MKTSIMLRNARTLFGYIGMALTVSVINSPIQAQQVNGGAAQQTSEAEPTNPDCGSTCLQCGFYKWEGYIHTYQNWEGPWDQTCDFNPINGYCTWCAHGAVSSQDVPALTIAETIEAVTDKELNVVLQAYPDRILLNPSKDQIIIKGTACDKEGQGAYVNISSARRQLLVELNVAEIGAGDTGLAANK